MSNILVDNIRGLMIKTRIDGCIFPMLFVCNDEVEIARNYEYSESLE